MPKEIILIGVCTYNRPIMLQKCLQSLVLQVIPDNAELIFVVADNNSKPEYNIKDTVIENKFTYLFVEKRGISFARNAILEAALQQNADFIAFIDDDEYAEKNWINNLYQKIKSSKASAVQGKVIYNLPPNLPAAIVDAWQFSCADDTILKHVSTNNIIFSNKLIKDWQLRFREKLALTGGEDLDFFLQSQKLGGLHIFTNNAIVYETMPQERSTIKWQLKRKMQDGFAVSYVTYLNNGLLYLLRKYVIKSFKNIIIAPLYIGFATILAKEKLKFKYQQKFYHALGCLAFVFNVRIFSYKNVTGG